MWPYDKHDRVLQCQFGELMVQSEQGVWEILCHGLKDNKPG